MPMRKYPLKISGPVIIGLIMALAGCANFLAIDKPLTQETPHQPLLSGGQTSNDLLVLLGFSGGGTRAAAFAYGVLKALDDTTVLTESGKQSLLREVDIISSVSGGSFTSAYYGLKGEKIFEEFEDRFLRKNVEGALIGKLFNPVNWVPLMSGIYGRSDMAAEYYGEHIFDHATFADLKRPGAPLVVINATDLVTGMRIAFIPHIFDLMCINLDAYPLARAVAASSAVPVLLTPVTIKNYAGACGYEPPGWLKEAANEDDDSSRKREANGLVGYLNQAERPWLHLVDGGIADNLGLRAFYTPFSLTGDVHETLRFLGISSVRHVLIISVNSFAEKKTKWSLLRDAPGIADVIQSISSDQIGRYNYDTLDIVRYSYDNWTKQVSTPQQPVTFDFVEVSFNAVRDAEQRRALNEIGTNFDLGDEDVDLLITTAGQVVRESAEFQSFLQRTNGTIKPLRPDE